MANKVPIKSHPVESWTLNGGKGGRLAGLLVSKKQDKARRLRFVWRRKSLTTWRGFTSLFSDVNEDTIRI
jgi:hypothetical protein